MTDAATKATGDVPVALVTAGAGGIGRVIAEAFIERGYCVHVCDIDATAIDSFLQANPGASATLADVSDVAQVEQIFSDIVGEYDHLDVLVNNAGVSGPTANVEDIEPAEWEKTIAVNLNGQFYCTRKAVPMLKTSASGSIINIASNAAFFGCPRRAPYAASKWAAVGFTKTLAMELGPLGIRVNAICPCSVEGERIDAVIEKDAKRSGKSAAKVREMYLRQSSMRSFVSAEDIANLALFLASDKSAKISGQALGLDGHTETLMNWFD